MRILAFILLCGVMFGLSGCGVIMVGNNLDDERRCETRMPCPNEGGLINKNSAKYYWGDIKITTKPAGLEVELYNNGKPTVPRTYTRKKVVTEKIENYGTDLVVCMQASANIGLSHDAAVNECKYTSRNVTTDVSYTFDEGLVGKTTPTTARLYARNEENKKSNYVLVFKKNGKEIARREIKTHMNLWIWFDHLMPPALGTVALFPREMAWLEYGEHAHLMQTRSYLTQGDIEIDLTEEIKKLGL